MTGSISRNSLKELCRLRLAKVLCLIVALHVCGLVLLANPEIETSEDDTTVIVNDAPEQDVIAIGRSIIIKRQAKSALSIGGDIIVEGSVTGDVATIGGNITQKENGYVGGDVIVIGGNYKGESAFPLREKGKETVTIGIFEEELRNFGQNPSQIFAPSFSLGFVIQRLVLALLWFIVSMVFTTLAPGAVGRAVGRLQLSTLKIAALGAVSFILLSVITITGSLILPNFLSATVLFMGLLLFLLAYVFGRVSLQVATGKLFFKYFLSDSARSETLITLTGVMLWTLLLSLPYVWIIALFSIFTFGIGLILTGRTSARWQNP